MKKILLSIILLLILSAEVYSQQQLTGNLSEDSKIAFRETMDAVPQFSFLRAAENHQCLQVYSL
jgi:hypothetical protein